MSKVIGVRFRNLGKIYHFDTGDWEIKKGDHVIVETSRGLEYGRVVFDPKDDSELEKVYSLKEVLRVATKEDDEQEAFYEMREREAYELCLEKIREHHLDMKLIATEYTFSNKIMFYFTSEGRVDFRDLVKDLASVFKTRIELRQVGVRDETKFMGGIGICGRSLCCHSYLTDFGSVSIRMAKEQNLSLNQTKISGVCGRLMCCLKNEQETYEQLNKTLPKTGEQVMLPDGMVGTVHSTNVLQQTVKVMYEVNDEKEIEEFPVDELMLLKNARRSKGDEEPQEVIPPNPPKKETRKREEGAPSRSQFSQERKDDKKKKPPKPPVKKGEGKKVSAGAAPTGQAPEVKKKAPKKKNPEGKRPEGKEAKNPAVVQK